MNENQPGPADEPDRKPDPDELRDGQVWDSVPDPEPDGNTDPLARAAWIASECHQGRWLPLMARPVDSDLLDSLAGVRAVREDNTAALAVILRNANPMAMSIVMMKLLSEMLDESEIEDSYYAVWASHALNRGE